MTGAGGQAKPARWAAESSACTFPAPKRLGTADDYVDELLSTTNSFIGIDRFFRLRDAGTSPGPNSWTITSSLAAEPERAVPHEKGSRTRVGCEPGRIRKHLNVTPK